MEQSKPHIFYIQSVHFGFFHNRVLHLAFPSHTSNWFIPQFNSERSAKWWILLWSECSTSVLSQTRVTVGIGLGLLQMVCCIIFLLFLFLGTCFHYMTVIKIACKWGHTSICNKYSNRGSQRHKLDFVATRWQDVITKLNHICVSQGTSFSCL